MNKITAVIPAYNEESRIAATLQAVKAIDCIDRIIVVSDGSTDKTAAIARRENVEVLELHDNRGKGGAMNAALPLLDSEVTVFLDADLGDSAREAEKIIRPVLEGETDLCIAAFPPPTKKGGFGLVKGTAARAIKKAGNMDARAPLSGQRAMNMELLKAVTPFSEKYGVELAMTIKALQKGFRVMEVTTAMRHNETGRDWQGFIHRGRQFVDVMRVLLGETRR